MTHKIIKLYTDRLEKLEIENWADELCGDCKLELHTPNLSSFVYEAVNIHVDCEVGIFAALVKANALFDRVVETHQVPNPQLLERIEASDATKLLKGLDRVESLSLKEIQYLRYLLVSSTVGVDYSLFACKCFEQFPNTLGDLLASYGKLKKLELSLSLGNPYSILWLTTLLSSCSLLETFVLKMFKTFDSEDKVEPVLPLPYTLNHLKDVTIEGVEELNTEFEFLRFLFNNAVNLKRMDITGYAINRERVPEFRDKLMALFQQFPNVQVSLQVY